MASNCRVEAPDDMSNDRPRFLLYKDYQSGLSNQVMSTELAVGLAHATGRTLVLYGTWDSRGGPRPIMGGHSWHVPAERAGIIDNRRVPTILDLIDDLPVPRLDYRAFLEIARDRALSRFECPFALFDTTFIDRLGPSQDIEAFSAGRFALTDPVEDVFHLFRSNLGYFSRIFYNPSPELTEKIAAVRLRDPYRALARAAAETVKPFNALHVRLADFRKAMDVAKIFPDDAEYGRVIANTLREHFSPAHLLLICTDEPWSKEIFDPIRKNFPRCMMVDSLLTERFADAFKALPFRDEVTFAAICQAILFEAEDFVGTPRSTFSGLIHRAVHARPTLRSKPFKFTFSGFADGAAAFDRGVYVECEDGPYSWNRVRMPVSDGQKSWVREWPESIDPRRVALDTETLPTHDPRQMVNVALGRQARQSTVSQWSNAYDANRAVSGWRNGSFMFHTDFEDAPWWEVDLGRAFPVDRIVVYNRQQGCFERARTLSISLRADAEASESMVYSSRDSFVGIPPGTPLVVTLGGRRARFVRLQLHERTALHLQQVEIFVQPRDYAREIAQDD